MLQYIEIFNKKITTYSLAIIAGILISGFFLFKKCKKDNVDINIVLEIVMISFLGAFVCSHLLYGIVNYEKIIILLTHLQNLNSFQHLLDCLYEIFGGSVFYGGLLGGILFGYSYCRIKKYNILNYVDVIAIYIPLFHCFGRIGCFMMGCCYGIESPYGINYPIHNGIDVVYKNIIPIQLIEAFFNFCLFLIINNLYNRKKKDLLFIYLIMYSVLRFILEFFRGDIERGIYAFLSTSQIISIIIFIIATIVLLKKKKIKLQ